MLLTLLLQSYLIKLSIFDNNNNNNNIKNPCFYRLVSQKSQRSQSLLKIGSYLTLKGLLASIYDNHYYTQGMTSEAMANVQLLTQGTIASEYLEEAAPRMAGVQTGRSLPFRLNLFSRQG